MSDTPSPFLAPRGGGVLVKICGLTRREDVLAAAEAGADLLGFVFAPSPRRVDASLVREIARDVPPGVLKVGVFVDQGRDGLLVAADAAGLDLVQLHGSESPELCSSLPVGTIKALRVRGPGAAVEAARYRGAVRYLLLDAWHPRLAGGTGLRVESGWTEGMTAAGVPWLLAGGLTAASVARAVDACRPDGVDVSGGVESSPGVKDRELIRRFVAAAKGG